MSCHGDGRCTDSDVVIPAEHNGRPVVSIDNGAFSDCGSLKSIIIPDSVTSIGYKAFAGCDSLKFAITPSSVSSVGKSVFCDCKSFKAVFIPYSVKLIDDMAFHDCASLKDVYYPRSRLDWLKIQTGSGNEPLKNAAVHYKEYL